MFTPRSFNSLSSDRGRIVSRGDFDRNDEIERQRLEEANLDLKLKLHRLEINTKLGASRISDDKESFPSTFGAQSAVFLQQLDDKSIEIEQRNQLLIRAKDAIEALQSELEKLRYDSETYAQTLNDQLKRAKKDNDELNCRYHENSLGYESKMKIAENLITSQGQLRSQAEEKLVSIPIPYPLQSYK
jgi:hypothetical protein